MAIVTSAVAIQATPFTVLFVVNLRFVLGQMVLLVVAT